MNRSTKKCLFLFRLFQLKDHFSIKYFTKKCPLIVIMPVPKEMGHDLKKSMKFKKSNILFTVFILFSLCVRQKGLTNCHIMFYLCVMQHPNFFGILFILGSFLYTIHVPSDDGSIVFALILYTFSTEAKNKEPDQWTYHTMWSICVITQQNNLFQGKRLPDTCLCVRTCEHTCTV